MAKLITKTFNRKERKGLRYGRKEKIIATKAIMLKNYVEIRLNQKIKFILTTI